VVGPEMDEEQPRLFVEHVAVDRGDLDVAGTQCPDQGIDLVARKQEVAGDGGLTVASGLEVDGIGAAQRSGDAHAALHGWIAPRDAELVDPSIYGSLGAHRLVNLGGVEIEVRG